MKKPKVATKLALQKINQENAVTPDPETLEKSPSGPVTIHDVHSELLRKAGLALDDITAAINTLRVHLKSKEPFAAIQAAKQILQLAGAYPSRNVKVQEQVNVQVSFKPFAQARVIDAEAVAAEAEIAG